MRKLVFVALIALVAMLTSGCNGEDGFQSPTSPTIDTTPSSQRVLVNRSYTFSLDPGTPDQPSGGVGVKLPSEYSTSGILEVEIKIEQMGDYKVRVGLTTLTPDGKYTLFVGSPKILEVSGGKVQTIIELPEETGQYTFTLQRMESPVRLTGSFDIYFVKK